MGKIIMAAVVGSVLAVLVAVGVMELLNIELSSAVIGAIGGAVGASAGTAAAARAKTADPDSFDGAFDAGDTDGTAKPDA